MPINVWTKKFDIDKSTTTLSYKWWKSLTLEVYSYNNYSSKKPVEPRGFVLYFERLQL